MRTAWRTAETATTQHGYISEGYGCFPGVGCAIPKPRSTLL